MKIGLTYDIRQTGTLDGQPEDAFEEYDSPETVEALASAVAFFGHEVVKLGGGAHFLNQVALERPDFVFNISEGLGNYRSRESQVPAVLEMLGIPYSGSDPLTLAVCLEKPLTKQLVQAAGVETPCWRIISSLAQARGEDWSGFPFPAFAKPAHEGSSKGIRNASRVDDSHSLRLLLEQQLSLYGQPVMVEEYIAGEEITVGMVGNGPPQVVGIMRVVPRRADPHFVYSLEVKRNWREMVSYECPAALPTHILNAISRASRSVFQTLEVRDVARVDFRVTAGGIPYFLEINPLPGMNPVSGDIVIMAGMMGWDYNKLIGSILGSALGRYGYAL